MKYLVVFVLVVAVSFVQAQNAEQAEKLRQHHEACAKEVTVDPALVTKAKQGDFVDDQALKDYLFCVGKRSGLINEAGEIQKDVLLKKTTVVAGKEAATKLVDTCAIQQKTPQDTNFFVAQCFWDKSAPKHFSLL